MPGRTEPAGPPEGVRRIVLVGFMAAGKSTIGPRLAHALGWRVFDVDAEITARAGKSVAAIFHEDGEPAFRAMEAELTAGLCSGTAGQGTGTPGLPAGEATVVVTGGGWIASPASRRMVEDPGTRLIWLRITAEESLRRAQQDKVERPLLAAAGALERAKRLLAEREPLYAAADLVIDVDGRTADAVLDDILTWLKTSIS